VKQKQEKEAQRLPNIPALIEAIELLDPKDVKRFLDEDVEIDKTHTLKRRELAAKALLSTMHLKTSSEGKRESLRLAKQLLKLKDQQ